MRLPGNCWRARCHRLRRRVEEYDVVEAILGKPIGEGQPTEPGTHDRHVDDVGHASVPVDDSR